MKRMHLHVAVDNLDASVRFYSTLFGATPTINKPDYAKWMLEDPRVNFAISQRGAKPGLDHVGIQVDSDAELDDIRRRLEQADLSLLTESATTCCYAKSDKHWVQDPSGIAWETYRTLDSAPTFSGQPAPHEAATGCCAPTPEKVAFISRQGKAV